MIKRFFRWLFADLLNEEWERAYQECERSFIREKRAYVEALDKKYPNHNFLFKIRFFGNSEKELLDEVDGSVVSWRLLKVNDKFEHGLTSIFIIQLKYADDDREYTARVFADADIEYAENCAREAFHYLTTEI